MKERSPASPVPVDASSSANVNLTLIYKHRRVIKPADSFEYGCRKFVPLRKIRKTGPIRPLLPIDEERALA